MQKNSMANDLLRLCLRMEAAEESKPIQLRLRMWITFLIENNNNLLRSLNNI